MSRTRLNIFIEPEHGKRLDQLAAHKGVSKSAVIAAALASPVSTRSAMRSPSPTTAALRTLPRTTVTSPCTVLKVPWRGSAAALPGACAIAAAAMWGWGWCGV